MTLNRRMIRIAIPAWKGSLIAIVLTALLAYAHGYYAGARELRNIMSLQNGERLISERFGAVYGRQNGCLTWYLAPPSHVSVMSLDFLYRSFGGAADVTEESAPTTTSSTVPQTTPAPAKTR